MNKYKENHKSMLNHIFNPFKEKVNDKLDRLYDLKRDYAQKIIPENYYHKTFEEIYNELKAMFE